MCRELTRDERKTIRRLVTGMCANYDSEYGCLPLDCPCYMPVPLLPGGGAASGPGAGKLPYRGGGGAGNKAMCRMREALYSRRAASLLLRSLQDRGQPPQEPGAYAEKAREKQGAVLRLGPVKPLYFRAFCTQFERS